MGVLNFSTDSLITGINIIDGNLYWTDDRSQPKKLEIDRFRDTTTFTDGVTVASNGDLLTHTDVSVIRPHPYKVIDLDLEGYTPTDEQPEPPFEKIFPRFSYRWRYEDGQYSPMAPFTQAAFVSQDRTTTTNNENYTEGFNTTLFNNVGTIVLDNIPRGTRDVVAVELLYTESISSTIYVIETLEIPSSQRGLDYVINSSRYISRFTGSTTEQPVPQDSDYDLLPLRYSITERKIYRALPPNQLTRHFDNVPRLAKAQEITANRLIYANYLHNFEQPTSVNFTTGLIASESFPYLATTSPESIALVLQSETDGLHVKGNRTYEVGVAYIDPYGRQGAMIPSGSLIAEDGTVTRASSFRTPFNQTTRQALTVTINDEPPSWADSYRYFIKDVSMDHHNLVAYNIYNDGALNEAESPYVWAEFLSTDRNKIIDDTILIPRRTNAAIEGTKQRHLVQEIENEAPNAVRNQIASGPDVEYIPQGLGSLSGQFQYKVNSTFGSAPNFLPVDANAPSGRFTYISEPSGTNGLSQYGWFAALNGFLAQNRLDTLQEVDESVRTVDNSGDEVAPPTPPSSQSVSIPFDVSQQLYIQFNGQDDFHQVKGLTYAATNSNNSTRDVLAIETYEDIGTVGNDATFSFHTARITEEAQERLQGRFWVRIARNNLNSGRSLFMNDGEISSLHQVWFETEPTVDDSQLDLFWETSQTFCVCTEHGWPNKLDWFNCFAEVDTGVGVYLESQRINNQFNSIQLVKGVRVNVPQDRYNEERRSYGLTWSGIYNSRTGINRLNQFITADGITKELEPNYGSIQKLHTRDTNVIAFAEDKIFRILADKDLLFNADGGGNVSASNQVLGQTTPFVGEYGISTNPESFASYGHNIYCSDTKRGAMLQITPGNGQIFEISERGLDDFFRDRLPSTDRVIGMYDDYSNAYTVSIQGYDPNDPMIGVNDRLPDEGTDTTLRYELSTEGWPARYSFIPEQGITLNNRFYTFSGGQMYMHNDPNANRNNFYGTQYNSEIEVIFNDQPSAVKEFLTLGYEGTANWTVIGIDTESDDTALTSTWPFKRKEGKYFAPIVGEETIYGFEDMEMGESIMSDDDTPVALFPQGTQETSGIKGFYNIVRLQNASTEAAELFAINTENYISSN